MNKEKQIEEMAKALTNYERKLCERLPKDKCLLTSAIHAQVSCDYCKIAEFFYNAGYRKQSEGEWISVEDRLPERNGRYLTHCNVEGQSLVCILYYCNVGGFNEGAVTHWMPLPEPPKLKGE